jgi:hypothetical protein
MLRVCGKEGDWRIPGIEEMTMLWIKTRVGLCALRNDCEIRTYRADKTNTWGIFAQMRTDAEYEGRGLFGKFSVAVHTLHLAYFLDHDGVQAEIGKAMQLILDALQSNAPLCDLSGVGTADAWTPRWTQVQWPK